MEKPNDEVEEKQYNFRSQAKSEQYDGVWERNWKNILPIAPEKPSEETGVWRLIDGASDWKDISENVADIPDLRPRPRHWLTYNDGGQDHFNRFLPKDRHHKKKQVTTSSSTRPVVMCDKAVQTEPSLINNEQDNECVLSIEHCVYIM